MFYTLTYKNNKYKELMDILQNLNNQVPARFADLQSGLPLFHFLLYVFVHRLVALQPPRE